MKRKTLALAISLLFALPLACERPERAEAPTPAEERVAEAPVEEPLDLAAEVGDIGVVHFQISCNEEAQTNFEIGLGLLHHMWYEGAGQGFQQAIWADPEYAMAYSGLAMTYYTPLWYPPTDQAVQRGTRAVERAQQLEATEREQAFIDAIADFYEDYDRADHLQHAAAFRDGWREAHQRDPADVEAASFYALGILATAPATSTPPKRSFAASTSSTNSSPPKTIPTGPPPRSRLSRVRRRPNQPGSRRYRTGH